jgi:hypothetical protein
MFPRWRRADLWHHLRWRLCDGADLPLFDEVSYDGPQVTTVDRRHGDGRRQGQSSGRSRRAGFTEQVTWRSLRAALPAQFRPAG